MARATVVSLALLAVTSCWSPYGEHGKSSDDGEGEGERGSGSGPSSITTKSASSAVVRVRYAARGRAMTLHVDGVEIAMKDMGADVHEADLGVLPADVKIVPRLDGIAARGPAWTVRPGETREIQPSFFGTKGSVATRWSKFKSAVHPLPFGIGRPIEVYLPPSYEENPAARYPVVYVMDGQMMLGTDALVVGAMGDMKVDEALDAGFADGTIGELIVVAIDSPMNPPPDTMMDRALELTPTNATDPTGSVKKSGNGPKFLSMIIDEIKPMVDAELRTRPGAESTLVMGASLGGLMAVWAGATRGDVFGGVASISGSTWWDESFVVRLVEKPAAGAKIAARAYADVGSAEDGQRMVAANRALFAAYEAAGYVPGTTLATHVEPDAEHRGADWAKRVPSALAFLVPGR